MFVPYALCQQIINRLIDNTCSYNELIKKVGFTNEAIYKKTNKVPLSEYYNLIYQSEKKGYNILSIYDKKEDILLNFSKISPNFGIFCLNNKNLYSAIIAFISLINLGGTDRIIMESFSKNEMKILLNPPCTKLKNIIYLDLGVMLVIFELVKYYLPNDSNLNITMNFIGGSQPHNEYEITKDLNCNVIFNNIETSIIIETPFFNKPFKYYNSSLDKIKKESGISSSVIISSDINKDDELIEGIIFYIRKSIYNTNVNKKPSIEYIAKKIKIPVWTLQRRLSRMGRTYSDILNNTLIEIAMENLYEGKGTILEISEMLGFSSQAAFTRFFKSMTGTTPLAYKNVININI